jgi:hypothetical protein
LLFDINLILLIAELALLIPTLLLLLLGRREERGRRTLLQEITRTAKMLSRQEYFSNIQSSMQIARESIKGSITGSRPKSQYGEIKVQEIVDQIHHTKSRNVAIQYLVPQTQDRITIASRYEQAGAEVRFHPALLINDIRYTIIDHTHCVIGLPRTAGRDEPTREGYSIPSEGLAEILTKEFDGKWIQGTKYEDYLRQVVMEIKHHNPNVSTILLSAQLKIPESQVKEILTE